MIRTVETPWTFRESARPAIRRGDRRDIPRMGVGWKPMNVAAATEPLLERKEELARIESALADARTGRGRFVVVDGPAGIGKTAVLAAARTAAAEAGMRVLRSRATEMETIFGFGVGRHRFERLQRLERVDRRRRKWRR